MHIADLFWNASLAEQRQGYIEQEGCFICLFCGEEIAKGAVYPAEGSDYEADEYIRLHVRQVHGSAELALRKIAAVFQDGQTYTEKEVNQMLKGVYEDYATVRRHLIEYGFLDRKRDGSQYWLKERQ